MSSETELVLHLVFILAGNFMNFSMFLVFWTLRQPVGIALVMFSWLFACVSAFLFLHWDGYRALYVAWLCVGLTIAAMVYTLLLVFQKGR